jgi:hypothetical protein
MSASMNTSIRFAHAVVCGVGLACALSASVAMAATTCDKLPVKPERTQAIGRDMIVNGVPTSVLRMEFAGSPDDVSTEFRQFWTREAVPAKGRRGPSGLLLSALDGACFYLLTIPVQPARGKTGGLLSVTRVSDDPVSHQIPESAVSLPAGSRTVTDVESRDPGQAGRTWLLDLPGRAGENATNYRTQLKEQGWSSIAQSPVFRLDGSGQVMGSTVVMQRGHDHIDAIFSDHDARTQAVVNATRNR